MRLLRRPPVARAVAETPPTRDRVVDAARAAALSVVVVGHGVMAVVAWPDGVPVLGNLLAAYPWTQALTWVLQIMPLFFWAGGAAGALSLRTRHERGLTYAAWLWGRGQRLLRPVWPYLAVMSAVAASVTWLAPDEVAEPLLALVTQLLWFLGAYLLVTALLPVLVPSDTRGLVLRLLLLVGATALVEAGRFSWGWPEYAALANFALVWSVPAVLGAARARGVFDGVGPAALAGIAIVTAAIDAALIALGPWPVSMVGMPGEPVSNIAPPTLVLALHCIVLAVLVQALDRPLTRLLHRPRAWRATLAVNLTAMTIYLWHLPVLIGLTALTHYLGLDRPVALDARGFPVPDGWWFALGSLVFWAVYLSLVVVVVLALWPLEYARLPLWDSPTRLPAPRPGTAAAVALVATVLVGAATLALSATGLAGFPTATLTYSGVPLNPALSLAVLVGGGLALRWAGGPRRDPTAATARSAPATGPAVT